MTSLGSSLLQLSEQGQLWLSSADSDLPAVQSQLPGWLECQPADELCGQLKLELLIDDNRKTLQSPNMVFDPELDLSPIQQPGGLPSGASQVLTALSRLIQPSHEQRQQQPAATSWGKSTQTHETQKLQQRKMGISKKRKMGF